MNSLTLWVPSKKLALLLMAAQKHLYSLVLLLLIFFKVSATPIYLHHDDDSHSDQCELCEHAIQNQQVESPALNQIIVPETKFVLVRQLRLNPSLDNEVFSTISYFPFSRPPPFA